MDSGLFVSISCQRFNQVFYFIISDIDYILKFQVLSATVAFWGLHHQRKM